jgi:hypothetical protein
MLKSVAALCACGVLALLMGSRPVAAHEQYSSISLSGSYNYYVAANSIEPNGNDPYVEDELVPLQAQYKYAIQHYAGYGPKTYAVTWVHYIDNINGSRGGHRHLHAATGPHPRHDHSEHER